MTEGGTEHIRRRVQRLQPRSRLAPRFSETLLIALNNRYSNAALYAPSAYLIPYGRAHAVPDDLHALGCLQIVRHHKCFEAFMAVAHSHPVG